MTDTTLESQIESLLQAGLERLDDGDYEGALGKWNEVLGLDPDNERADLLVRDLRSLMTDGDDVDFSVSADYVVVLDDDEDALPGSGSSDARSAPSLITRTSLARLRALVDEQVEENRELNETIAKHYREVLELRSALTEHEQQSLDQRKRILDLEKQVSAVDDDRRELETKRKDFERMQAHYELKLVEQKQQRDEAGEQIAALEAELDAARGAVADTARALDSAQARIDELTTASDAAREALDAERTEHDATRALLDDASGRADALDGEVAKLDKQIDLAKGEIAALRKTLETERVQLETAQDEVRELRTRLKVAEQSQTRAERELEARVADLAARTNDLADAAEQVAELTGLLEKRTGERDDARAAAETGQATVTQLESDLAAMAEARDAATERAERAEAVAAEHASTRESTRTELVAVTEARDALQQELAEVAEARDALQQELAEVAEARDTLQSRLASTIEARDEAARQRDAVQARLDEAADTSLEAAQQLEAHAQREAELEARLTAIEVERDQVRHEHQSARELAESRAAVIETLREELAQRDERLAEITLEYKRRSSDDHRLATEEAERLRAQLNEARELLGQQQGSSDEVTRLRDELEAVQAELQEARAALADATAAARSSDALFDPASTDDRVFDGVTTDPEHPDPGVPTGSTRGRSAPPPAPMQPPHETGIPMISNQEPTGAWDAVAESAPGRPEAVEPVSEPAEMVFQLEDDFVPPTGELEPDEEPAFELAGALDLSSDDDEASDAAMYFALEHEGGDDLGAALDGPAPATDRDTIRTQLMHHLTEAPRQVGLKLQNIEGIGQREAFLLGSVDGHTTFAEIIDHSPLSQDDGIEALVTLLEKGVIVSPTIAGPDTVGA